MVVEFLLLIGVFTIMLDQIRRLRAASQARIAEFEATIAAQQELITNLTNAAADATAAQAELDAFEADLAPAKPVEVTPEPDVKAAAV